MKKTIKLTESQLHDIVKESITRIILENYNQETLNEVNLKQAFRNVVGTATLAGMLATPFAYDYMRHNEPPTHYANDVESTPEEQAEMHKKNLEWERGEEFKRKVKQEFHYGEASAEDVKNANQLEAMAKEKYSNDKDTLDMYLGFAEAIRYGIEDEIIFAGDRNDFYNHYREHIDIERYNIMKAETINGKFYVYGFLK